MIQISQANLRALMQRGCDYLLAILFLEYYDQPKQQTFGTVLHTNHVPGVAGGDLIAIHATPSGDVVEVPDQWKVTVYTPYGECDIEISERLYNRLRVGDHIEMVVQLSRLHVKNKRLRGWCRSP